MSTGSQFHHEELYLTISGNFVLNCWSAYQGTLETFEQITKDEALRWFFQNQYDEEQIPEVLKEEMKKYLEEREI